MESATRRPRDPSTSSNPSSGRFSGRAQWLALLLGLALLETIPVAAWLETGAALQAGDPNQAALPFWFLLSVLLLALAIGRGTARASAGAAIVASVPILLVCFIVALRISPAAYAPIPEGAFGTAWLQALSADLNNGAARSGAVIGLAIVLGYLWWRGLYRGRREPSVETTRTLFFVSFSAVVLALAVAAAVPESGQTALAGRLDFLLLLEAFAGLASLALARTRTLADDRRLVAWSQSSERGRWLWLGLIMSGVTLLLAGLLSLVISYGTVLTALGDLGPVGELLDAGVQWLLYGISYALFFIFGGLVNWLISLSRNNTLHVPQPPPPPKGACSTPNCAPNIPPARGIAVAIFLAVLLVAVIVLLLFVAYHAIRSMRAVAAPTEQVDEREALDARGLLGAQLRSLFARRRAPAPALEALDPGSVRAVYRDVLRAAASAGLPRVTSETPDEYEARLEQSAGSGSEGDDLSALTHAYDRSRYGDDEPPAAEQRTLQALGRRLIARLRGRGG